MWRNEPPVYRTELSTHRHQVSLQWTLSFVAVSTILWNNSDICAVLQLVIALMCGKYMFVTYFLRNVQEWAISDTHSGSAWARVSAWRFVTQPPNMNKQGAYNPALCMAYSCRVYIGILTWVQMWLASDSSFIDLWHLYNPCNHSFMVLVRIFWWYYRAYFPSDRVHFDTTILAYETFGWRHELSTRQPIRVVSTWCVHMCEHFSSNQRG